MLGTAESPEQFHKAYPTTAELLLYWQIYSVDVDPVMKVLHVSTFGRKLIGLKADLQTLSFPIRALLLSICFAAVTSIPSQAVEDPCGYRREERLVQLRSATEDALSQIDFSNCRELEFLQALTIYLVC